MCITSKARTPYRYFVFIRKIFWHCPKFMAHIVHCYEIFLLMYEHKIHAHLNPKTLRGDYPQGKMQYQFEDFPIRFNCFLKPLRANAIFSFVSPFPVPPVEITSMKYFPTIFFNIESKCLHQWS